MRAIATFTPQDSKRVIGRGLKFNDWVTDAMEDGRILLDNGTTTSFVAEELGNSDIDKGTAVSGYVLGHGPCAAPRETLYDESQGSHIFFRDGDMERLQPRVGPDEMREMGDGDIYMQGANVIGSDDVAGVMLGAPFAGKLGKMIYGYVKANGVKFVIPASIAKYVPYPVAEFAELLHRDIELSTGQSAGMMPLVGHVYTEVEALEDIADVTVYPVAIGGLNEGRGAVTVVIDGEDTEVTDCFEIIEEIKAHNANNPMDYPVGTCEECSLECKYKGTSADELPDYFYKEDRLRND
jgi:hypothetical protein